MRAYSGYFFIILAAFFWALIGPVARFSFGSGLDPLELGFWRAAIGGGLFFIHAAVQRDLTVRSKRDLCIFLLFGAFSMGGFFACHQIAIKEGGAALAAVLLYTAPAWVAIFSRVLFKEWLTKAKTLAIALSLVGVALISLSSPDPEMLDGVAAAGGTAASAAVSYTGLLFGLLAGFLYSTHYIFTKNFLAVYKTYTLYGYSALAGAVVLFPFVNFATKSATDWAVAICLGAVCTYGAYIAYCAGMRRLEATRAAVIATMEPVIATALAWWIWDELFGFGGWIGSVLVLAAVLILVLGGGKKKEEPESGTASSALKRGEDAGV